MPSAPQYTLMTCGFDGSIVTTTPPSPTLETSSAGVLADCAPAATSSSTAAGFTVGVCGGGWETYRRGEVRCEREKER